MFEKDVKLLNHFKVVESEISYSGVAFLNDSTSYSDFAISGYGVPLIRTNDEFNIESLYEDGNAEASGELVSWILSKLAPIGESGKDSFLLLVTIDQTQGENFSLHFSSKANLALLNPAVKNYEMSNLKFGVEKNVSNKLFTRIEQSVPKVSCFEIRLRESWHGSRVGSNSIDRVLEDAMIFAALATSKRI